MFQFPKDKKELQRREAIGVIRASRFVRKYASSHDPINMDTICDIHKEIFNDAWVEIAGKYRIENLKITGSKHLPPHFKLVSALMNESGIVFVDKLEKLKGREGMLVGKFTEEALGFIYEIVSVAAWIHHKITFIHPFREGNGRTARLAANLILERYGLVGISIKIEKENKDQYRQTLAQIDLYEDYGPLEELIYEGIIERYDGVCVKYYEYKK